MRIIWSLRLELGNWGTKLLFDTRMIPLTIPWWKRYVRWNGYPVIFLGGIETIEQAGFAASFLWFHISIHREDRFS